MRNLAFKNYHTGLELQSWTRFLQFHNKLPTTLTRANFSVHPPYYWSFGLEVIMRHRKKEHFLLYDLTHNCCNGQNGNIVFRGIAVGFKVTDWFFCLTRIPVNVVVSHSCQRRRRRRRRRHRQRSRKSFLSNVLHKKFRHEGVSLSPTLWLNLHVDKSWNKLGLGLKCPFSFSGS